MNFKRIFLSVGTLIGACSFTTGYDWTQAWVDKNVLYEDQLPRSVLTQMKPLQLTLTLLTKKDLVTTPSNGNTYLRCYLVNYTDTTTAIGRADATLTGFSTEILKDSVWQHFQRDMPSTCGNSYWTQKLESRRALAIQLDHAESGSVKVPFRIRYTHDNRVLYSNVITIDVDQVNYDRVGSSKK